MFFVFFSHLFVFCTTIRLETRLQLAAVVCITRSSISTFQCLFPSPSRSVITSSLSLTASPPDVKPLFDHVLLHLSHLPSACTSLSPSLPLSLSPSLPLLLVLNCSLRSQSTASLSFSACSRTLGRILLVNYILYLSLCSSQLLSLFLHSFSFSLVRTRVGSTTAATTTEVTFF